MKIYVFKYNTYNNYFEREEKVVIVDADTESYAVYLFKKHCKQIVGNYTMTVLQRNGYSSVLYSN